MTFFRFPRRAAGPLAGPLAGPVARPVARPIAFRTVISAGVLAALAVLAGCTANAEAGGAGTHSNPPPASATPASAAVTTAPSSTSAVKPSPTVIAPRRGSGTPVHVSLLEGDGQTYGVAMPLIAFFSVAPTDASVFDKVVTVRVNGRIAQGAWYWENSSRSDEAIEAHYRLAAYWPAHASITMNMPVSGLWAGKGLVFDNDLTLAVKTGAAQVVQVNGQVGIDKMRVYSDGKLIRTFDISLGAADTPTYLGTAVVMAKANPQHMVSAPGESDPYSIEVPWSVRVTYDGEFLHDAYWNGQLGQENLSHGCTNMAPQDAEWYFTWSRIGDPVTWINTGTSKVLPVNDGYGDWNLAWTSYRKGGLLAA